MGRSPRFTQDGLNKGAWTAHEDTILTDYVKVHGEGKWSNVAKKTGLKRCGKSCRLRWMNYLRPDIKRGNISHDEEELIIRLHKLLGNRWSLIAGRLPGRTDNEIKNYWNTTLAKKEKDFELKVSRPIVNNNYVGSDDALQTEKVVVTTVYQPHRTKCSSTNFVSMGPSSKNLKMEFHKSPSSLSKEDDHNNAGDFMMDFNVEDICKFLDINDDKVRGDGGGGGDGDDDSSFLVKLEADIASSSEFLSLASFLESAEEWPGDELNISTQPGRK
ncbi:hypothetical protein SLEP1_g1908 [Rubroshorea leprosula]|uniref:Uncharacterized protein n=1 Tax=Rubroshorea leprosula TaxID=152421 RepID=A0AAV5HPV6_9ROSI|nr:hypothetical protein SLEP1_g1908 [Rubroshorea leprosula]